MVCKHVHCVCLEIRGSRDEASSPGLGKRLSLSERYDWVWCCTPFIQVDISGLKPGLHRKKARLVFSGLKKG